MLVLERFPGSRPILVRCCVVRFLAAAGALRQVFRASLRLVRIEEPQSQGSQALSRPFMPIGGSHFSHAPEGDLFLPLPSLRWQSVTDLNRGGKPGSGVANWHDLIIL